MKLLLKYIIDNIYAIDVDSSLEAVGCVSHRYNKFESTLGNQK
jgi:hypothetical protein